MVRRGLWVLAMVTLYLFYYLIFEWVGAAAALLSLAILVNTPAFGPGAPLGSLTTGYADFPLAAFLLVGVGLLLRFLREGDRLDLLASSLALAAALLIKREGLLFFLFLSPMVILTWRRWPKRLEPGPWLWVAVPVGVTLWMWISHWQLPPAFEIRWPRGEQWSTAIAALGPAFGVWTASLRDWRLWGVLPVLLGGGYAAALWRCRRHPGLPLALPVVLQLTAIIGFLALSEGLDGLLDYYTMHTYPRLIIQLVPVTFLLVLVLNSSAFQRLSIGRR